MARLKIQLPKSKLFETEITLRISDINYGGHLANDAVLSLVHEARIRFLTSLGYSEKDIEGKGIIMTDAGIVYKSQGYYADRLSISLSIDDISRMGFDLYYQIKNISTNAEIARVKTGIAFFDYEKNRITEIPEKFIQKIASLA